MAFILIACLACISHGKALGQGNWEFLGPEVGYRPEALFVSQNAIYLGLCEEDLTTGLGLHRYRFDVDEWDLFAWEGYRILGITVWGESDKNILLIRYGGPDYDSDVLRSTDGGDTWVSTQQWGYRISGLSQASSDTSYVVAHYPMYYSTDGGWSWNQASGYPPNGVFDVSFDPSNALVAYLTGQNEFGDLPGGA